MCNVIQCKLVRKEVVKMSYREAYNQLEKCEKCVYRNPHATEAQEETYKVVRLDAIEKYWEYRR